MDSARIAVVMTCHNRRQKTLECLSAVKLQVLEPSSLIQVFLLDDASTDGTADAVSREYPEVRLLRGDGGCFWNGGMRRAFQVATSDQFDHYLWLNDDTILDRHAVQILLDTYKGHEGRGHRLSIVVGSTRDPVSGELTYGGVLRRTGLLRTKFVRIAPDPEVALPCDTMNGNFVLIPRAVAERVGNLSQVYTHAMGDYDYGLRAQQRGVQIWVAPGFHGECARNAGVSPWLDRRAPLRSRIAKLLGPKGFPVGEWCHFCRNYFGTFWPLQYSAPYVKFVFFTALGFLGIGSRKATL